MWPERASLYLVTLVVIQARWCRLSVSCAFLERVCAQLSTDPAGTSWKPATFAK